MVRLSIISLTLTFSVLRSCLHVKFPSQTEHCLSSAPQSRHLTPAWLRRGGGSPQQSENQGRTCISLIPASSCSFKMQNLINVYFDLSAPGINSPPPRLPRSWITVGWSWHGHRLETDERGVSGEWCPLRIMLQKLPDDEESRELDCVFLPVDLDLIALGISRQPDSIKK